NNTVVVNGVPQITVVMKAVVNPRPVFSGLQPWTVVRRVVRFQKQRFAREQQSRKENVCEHENCKR
ncbi:hypothetical protein KA005_22120, partial [bacterium]|nr:hypothetical protein [bacterium]